MFSNKKILIFIITIVVILAIGIFYVWQGSLINIKNPENGTTTEETQEEDEEENDWKIYKSPQVGFSIQSPPGITVYSDIPGDYMLNISGVSLQSLYLTRVLSEGSEEGLTIEVNSWEAEKDVSFQGFIEKEKDFFVRDPEVKNIFLDGVLGKKLFVADENNSVFRILMERNNRFYRIYAVIKNEEAYLPIFDKMISSFKFVDEDETYNWEVYNSRNYDFEIKYPKSAELNELSAIGDEISISLPFNEDTTLREKYLRIKVVDPSPEECSIPVNISVEETQEVSLNGLDFKREEGWEGAAGTRHDYISYSTKNNGRCFNLMFVLGSVNPGVFDDPPEEFNEEEETKILYQMLSTFKIEKGEMSEWEDYISEEYGYRIKHPSNWISREEEIGDSERIETIIERENCSLHIMEIVESDYERRSSYIESGCYSEEIVQNYINFDKITCPTRQGFSRYYFEKEEKCFYIEPMDEMNDLRPGQPVPEEFLYNCQEYFDNMISTFIFN